MRTDLDALAAAEGLTRWERKAAQRDALAEAAGYTDFNEQRKAERRWPSNCWHYRVVHDPGVNIRRTPDFSNGDEDGNLTGEGVLKGTLVGVVECRPRSDGVTYLKLCQSALEHGEYYIEGWVFDQSPDGTACLKLVRKAK